MYWSSGNTKWPVALDNDTYNKQGSAKLAYDEYWVECPFDQSHRALNTKFDKHLLKCRRNYENGKIEAGQPVKYVLCRYNIKHKVLPPELLLHEQSCQKEYGKGGVLVDFLFRKELGKFGGPWQNLKLSKQAIAVIALLDVLPQPPTMIPEGRVLYPNSKVAKAGGKSLLAQKDPLDDKMFMITQNSENFDKPARRPSIRKRVRAVDVIGYPGKEDDDATWNTPNSGVKFDWLENWKHLKFPIHRYPPGLSRAQRKQFILENEIRMKTEMGLFVSEERTCEPFGFCWSPPKELEETLGNTDNNRQNDWEEDNWDAGKIGTNAW